MRYPPFSIFVAIAVTFIFFAPTAGSAKMQQQDIFERLLTQYQSDPSVNSVRILWRIRDIRNKNNLTIFLKHFDEIPDDEFYVVVAEAILDYGTPAQRESLLTKLEKLNEHFNRRRPLNPLFRPTRASRLPVLINIAKNSKHTEYIRNFALSGIAYIGSAEATRTLTAMLERAHEGEDREFEQNIVSALASIRSDKSLPIFQKSIRSKKNFVVDASLRALAHMESPAAASLLIESFEKHIVQSIDPVPVFNEMDNHETIPPLLSALQRIPDTEVPLLRGILRALGNMYTLDGRTTKALIDYARRIILVRDQLSFDDTSRKAYGDILNAALVAITSSHAGNQFLVLTDSAVSRDTPWEIRIAAIQGVGTHGWEGSIEALEGIRGNPQGGSPEIDARIISEVDYAIRAIKKIPQ